MIDKAEGFDPARYLVSINGRGEYLEVKWRLFWLRSEHPDAVIETKLIREGENDAVFRARISIPDGGAATGWGSETRNDFRDFLEKAETKAIGRALAALGYGTQFCQDHEFGGEAGQVRVVDAPVEPRRAPANRPAPAARGQAPDAHNQRASEKQVKFIWAISAEAGLDGAETERWCEELYSVAVDQLSRRDASAFIEALQRRRNEVA